MVESSAAEIVENRVPSISHAAIYDTARPSLGQLRIRRCDTSTGAIGCTSGGIVPAVAYRSTCDRAEQDACHHILRHLLFLALFVFCLGAQTNIATGRKVSLKFCR